MNMQDNDMLLKPIGYFHGSTTDKHRAPRQPDPELGLDGVIKLEKGHDFEQAVIDLEGFSHLWIVYGFHLAKGWKPMVLPPRGEKKRGVFATRSPYRPNPIGMSVVILTKISGLNISISGTDLLDGTPIYDIKPYIPYADARIDAKAGWIDDLEIHETKVHVSDEIQQCIQDKEIAEIITHAQQLLRDSPMPHPYRRIKHVRDNWYELSIKEWRIVYRLESDGSVMIETIAHPGSMK